MSTPLSKKRKNSPKKIKQSSLKLATTKKPKLSELEKLHQNSRVYLDDSIYSSGAPSRVEGHLFQFTIVAIREDKNGKPTAFFLRYDNSVSNADGTDVFSWREQPGEIDETMIVNNIDTITEGKRRYEEVSQS